MDSDIGHGTGIDVGTLRGGSRPISLANGYAHRNGDQIRTSSEAGQETSTCGR